MAENGSEDCFLEVETSLKLKIPSHLRKMLIVNGYNTGYLLANITDQDILAIESFAQNILPSVILETQYEEYYGFFHTNTKAYTIVSGHRKLISVISDYFSKKCGETANQEILNKRKTSKSLNSKNEPPPGATKDHRQSDDLTEENSHVSRVIKSWVKNKCNSQQWIHFEEKFKNVTVTTKLDYNNELACTVKCFCNQSITIRKFAKTPKAQKSWVYSNYNKHFNKSHLVEDEIITDESPEKKMRKEKYTGIRNYFHVVPPQVSPVIASTSTQDTQRSASDTCPKINVISDITLNVEKCANNNFPSYSITKNSNEDSNSVLRETLDCKASGSTSSNEATEDFEMSGIIENDIKNKYETKYERTSNATDGSCSSLLSLTLSNDITEDEPKKHVSKWSALKYQRKERSRRLREQKNELQPLITNYFPMVEHIASFVNEHQELIDHLIPDKTAVNLTPLENKEGRVNEFLEMLHNISLKNSLRSSNKNEYSEVLKKFSLYIYYIGGRYLYETLQANLQNILPSISSLNRFAQKNKRNTEEGVLDYDGLNSFLEERNLEKFVWLSEDATRITGKIEFDERTNKILGFTLPLENGLPRTNANMATSAKIIKEYFDESAKSNYAYVIMAQPLSVTAPAYCLSIFGTDNKFTHEDVQSRWDSMRKKLKELGITVLGFSSDGDTRLMKAMRLNSVLPIPKDQPLPFYSWEWFRMNYDGKNKSLVSYIQDTVHVATKLRTRLIKPGIVLPMGNYVASVSHLETLVKHCSKDQHMLTMSDLKPEDKMNYDAARKMCSLNIQKLLKDKVPDSEATIAYLKLMQRATTSFLEKEMSISQRLYNIWYCIFFLRIWRQWIKNSIKDKSGYTINNNFLSSNCYLSIELNGHSLITVIKIKTFQNTPEIKNNMFLPWLFSSQTCEKFFRTIRSMTSTFSTVVNFSVKDLLHRIDRIQSMNNIMNDLQDIFIFPRENRKRLCEKYVQSLDEELDVTRISDEQIQSVVESALNDCLLDTKNLGMTVYTSVYTEEDNIQGTIRDNTDAWKHVSIPLATKKTGDAVDDELDDEMDIDEGVLISTQDEDRGEDLVDTFQQRYIADIVRPAEELEINNTEFSEKVNEDLIADLCNISDLNYSFGKKLCLKDYSKDYLKEDRKNHNICEEGPFVRICFENDEGIEKTAVIKKSSLCWLLDERKEKVSTDRLHRFICKTKQERAVKERKSKQGQKISKKHANGNSRDTASKTRTEVKVKMTKKNKKTKYEECLTETSTEDETDSDEVILNDTTDIEQFTDDSTNDLPKNTQQDEEDHQQDRPVQDTKENCSENCNTDIKAALEDYIIVQLTSEKGQKKRFLAKVLSLNPYHCSFLKPSVQVANAFVFPPAVDEADIEETAIVIKLPEPKGRRGNFIFPKEILQEFLV